MTRLAEDKRLLKEIRKIKKLRYFNNKKRKNESDRDFIIKRSGGRCTYCRKKFTKEKLAVVKKNPGSNIAKIKNLICACKKCANEKRSMTDKEFKKYMMYRKKTKKKEIQTNYSLFSKRVFKKNRYTCIYCIIEYGRNRVPEGRKLTIDHKVPLSRGGTNNEKNLCCSCIEHNRDKADKTAEEYIKKIQRKRKEAEKHKR